MFSLRTLLVVVTLCAVYIAGMVYRTEWWRLSILTLTYLVFAGAATAAILSRGRRAFFVAFAVFGLAYGLCVHLRVDLVTDGLFSIWAHTIHQAKADIYRAEVDARRQEVDDPFADDPFAPRAVEVTDPFAEPNRPAIPPGRGWAVQPRSPYGDLEDTLRPLESIGHSFFAVLVGFVAGVVAEAIVRRKSQLSVRSEPRMIG